MTEHPTLSWEAMQDSNVFYRRQQVYSIHGKLPNLGDCIVAGGRYGGPIGMNFTCIMVQCHVQTMSSSNAGQYQDDCAWTRHTRVRESSDSGVLAGG